MKKAGKKYNHDAASAKKKSWRTPNAFVLFQESKREMIRTAFGTKKLQQVSKIASNLWQNASEEEKSIYVKKSNELRNQKVMESVSRSLGMTSDMATASVSNPSKTKKTRRKILPIPTINTEMSSLAVETGPSFGWTPTEEAFRPQFDRLLADTLSECFSVQTDISAFSQLPEIDQLFFPDYIGGQEFMI
jgi:HMG (high mobility group) box